MRVGVSVELEKIRDLRDWLAVAREAGEVTDVSGADWNLEIGTISQINYRRPHPKAMLFDDISGYPSGFRVLTGSMSNSARTALALRMGTDLDDAQLVDALMGKPATWIATADDYRAHEIPTAPVFENVLVGENADLSIFPSPMWNEHDGGRFIGTGCIVFTRDPETDEVNGGAYRIQVQEGGRAATVHMIPGKHGAQHVDRWFAREGRAPVTISIGHDPLLLMVAGTEVPFGVSELDYAGAMIGQSLGYVRSDLTGLPIPESSEIILEGWIDQDFKFSEGPFAEWTGHYSGSDTPIVAMRIERILHRNDPIILGSPPGKPPHDFSYMRTALKSAMIKDAITGAGVSGVKGVWAHESGGGRMLVVVSVQQRYHGHARQVAYLAAQLPAAAYMNRFVVIVDDDIDPTDLDDVIWAMCSRCDPGIDIEIMRRTWGSKADPLLVDQNVPLNSRAIIDACRPFERINDFPAVATASPELVAATRRKWAHLFGDEPARSAPTAVAAGNGAVPAKASERVPTLTEMA